MNETHPSTAMADLAPEDPEQILPVKAAFPDAREVTEHLHGLAFGPDVRFTTPDGEWATVQTMPMTTGVAFQVVCDDNTTRGGTVFVPYATVGTDHPAAIDLARALRVSGLEALEDIAARAERGHWRDATANVAGGNAA